MNITGYFILFFSIILLAFGFSRVDKYENNDFVISKMTQQIADLDQLSFNFKNCERIKGEIKCGEQKVSLITKPFKCHVLMLKPSDGGQIIYNNEVSKKATYFPNGFPYVNVELSPLGSQMRKNNHHSIFELGFGFYARLINHYFKTNKRSFTIVKINNAGNVEFKVTSVLEGFKYVHYVLSLGETFRTVAKKKFVSEYLINEHNQKKAVYEAGDTILIPNQYYQKLEVLINGENFTPRFIRVDDNKGLLEKYEFSNLNMNPSFTERMFTEKSGI